MSSLTLPASVRGTDSARSDAETQIARLVAHDRRLRRRDLTLGVTTPVLLVGLWQLAASWELVDTRIFTPPRDVLEAARRMLESGALWTDVRVSLIRLLVGFSLGSVLGVVVGLLMGYFRALRAALAPTMTALYALPKIAVIPLLLVIFGIGETPRILSVVIGTFFILQIATVDAVRGLDHRILEAGRAYGATGFKLFWHVVLRGAMPAVFTGLRLAAGIALIVVTATEFVAANDGLGYLIWNSWTLFQPAQMYVGLICAALLGYVFTAVVAAVERIALPWQSPRRPTSRVARLVRRLTTRTSTTPPKEQS